MPQENQAGITGTAAGTPNSPMAKCLWVVLFVFWVLFCFAWKWWFWLGEMSSHEWDLISTTLHLSSCQNTLPLACGHAKALCSPSATAATLVALVFSAAEPAALCAWAVLSQPHICLGGMTFTYFAVPKPKSDSYQQSYLTPVILLIQPFFFPPLNPHKQTLLCLFT